MRSILPPLPGFPSIATPRKRYPRHNAKEAWTAEDLRWIFRLATNSMVRSQSVKSKFRTFLPRFRGALKGEDFLSAYFLGMGT